MRSIDSLVSQLRGLGVNVWAEGDQLRCRAPTGALTRELRTELQDRKAQILDYLRRACENTASLTNDDQITPAPADERMRLSFTQQRLWFLDRLEGRSPAYNMPLATRLEGPVDQQALQRALDEIVRRHCVLRSQFRTGDDEPLVIISEQAKCPFAVFDSLPTSGSVPKEVERQLMLEEAERCFDLESDPLIRASLYRAGETSYLLFVTMHHIVSDGWSLGIFTSELAAIYDAFSAGRPSPLGELPIQYTDYALWQRKWLTGVTLEKQLAYWRNQLSGTPDVIDLPLDRPRPPIQTYRGGSYSFAIDAELTRRLDAFCQSSELTLFMGLLTGFSLLLSRYSGQADVVIGTAVANRRRPEIESLIGLFVNTLSRHDAIGQAVVVARDDMGDEKQLVAYIVSSADTKPTTEELRTFLKATLPDFMVPAAFLNLDAMPLTPNGKVDRKALPAPDRSRPDLRAVYQAPRTKTEKEIAAIWKEALEVDQVGIDDNFFDLGGHSLLMTRVHMRLRSITASKLALVELFQYPTVRTLAARISPNEVPSEMPRRRRPSKSANKTDDVAIIGLVGRFPDADDLQEFWQNLRDGRESISFFSDEEMIAAGVEPELVADPNYVNANGILSDVTSFDASFFGLTPAEAEVMDPQHRIFLESTWHVMVHAGYGAGAGDDAVGVFAACSHNRYLIFNLVPHLYTQSPHSIYQVLLGNDRDYLATRASYLLNLRGSSVNVQTACSSSLVAVHMAAKSLLDGESDMAVAGGVAIKVPQKSGYLYSDGMIVSPDGHCRAFDAGANGTTWGSGIGVVLLKRLGDACADRDTIYAVIKGSAINNDGALKVGFTAPAIEGQAEVIAEAHARAGVTPESISYVEAHGTGTPMGDPVEVAALTRAFGNSRSAPCWLSRSRNQKLRSDWCRRCQSLQSTRQLRVLSRSPRPKLTSSSLDWMGRTLPAGDSKRRTHFIRR